MRKMYHYTECGLTNVWLVNGFIRHRTPYGKRVAIENGDGLHRATCDYVAGMTDRYALNEWNRLMKK